jgi:hypothetical protein
VKRYEDQRGCPIGGFVSFWWDGTHDLVKMKDREHFDACDFDGATELASAANDVTQSYYFECNEPGAIDFLACSVGTHCADGQKLEVNTSSTERVTDYLGDTLIHSRSLAQVRSRDSLPARIASSSSRLLSHPRPCCACR